MFSKQSYLLLIIDRPPYPNVMLIGGCWQSSPRTDSKETLCSDPIELLLYSRPVVVAKLLSPT